MKRKKSPVENPNRLIFIGTHLPKPIYDRLTLICSEDRRSKSARLRMLVEDFIAYYDKHTETQGG